MTSVPFVAVTGDPFEVGRAHGAARADALRAFLDDGFCRLDRILTTPVTRDSVRPVLAAYRARIEESTPALARETLGLAEGAGIDADLALLLQVRREIMGYQRVPTRGDCTTYARSGPVPVLAQTVDLNGDLDDQICVLEINRRTLVLSFAGLLGYLGVNAGGLAVGLNLVLGGEWRPGLPPYLAIRHLLDTASTVDEAVAVLRGLRLASSRSLMLCDTDRTAYVEILGDELRVVTADESAHTNHFLHPDFAPYDELNVFARNFSLQRLKACRAALATLGPDAPVAEHFTVLSAEPVRVAGTGDIRRERTVATVVLRPGSGELHIRPGDSPTGPVRTFRLGRAPADGPESIGTAR